MYFKARGRNWLIVRKRECSQCKRSDTGGWYSRWRWELRESSEISRQRVPEMREDLRKELWEHLSLEVIGGRERQRWLKERVLPVGLILMRLRRCDGLDLWRRLWVIYMILYDIEQVKRFECRSDVWLLRSVGDGAS